MLRAAALGMFLYGGYCVVDGLIDFVFAEKLEWWANLWGIFSGILLTFGAIFTRISFPGGLALAISGLLGLQAISLHNEIHLYGQLSQTLQLSRIALAVLLVVLLGTTDGIMTKQVIKRCLVKILKWTLPCPTMIDQNANCYFQLNN